MSGTIESHVWITVINRGNGAITLKTEKIYQEYKRLSKISVTSKTHKYDDSKSCKLVQLNQKEVAFN